MFSFALSLNSIRSMNNLMSPSYDSIKGGEDMIYSFNININIS